MVELVSFDCFIFLSQNDQNCKVWPKKTSGKWAGEIAGFRLGLPENHSRMTEKLELRTRGDHVVTQQLLVLKVLYCKQGFFF